MLKADNWKSAAVRAVEELPPDIAPLVGYADEGPDRFTIRVAVETDPDRYAAEWNVIAIRLIQQNGQ